MQRTLARLISSDIDGAFANYTYPGENLMLHKITVFVLFILISTQVLATTVLKVGLDELAKKSEFVFEGKVLSKQVRRSPVTGRPCTYFVFSITDVIKGAQGQPNIELCFAGGSIMIDGKMMTMTVSDMTMPTLGETGVYFVDTLNTELTHPFLGWNQGHFLVKEDAAKVKRVMPAFPTLSAPGSSAAVTKQSIEIPVELDAFKQMIKDRQ